MRLNVVSYKISKVLNPNIKPHLYLTRKTERSDSILPHSLRGVGPYDPYGPEADFPPVRRRKPLWAGGRIRQM